MSALLCAEETFTVGEPTVVDAMSPTLDLAVVFEDNGETGYLYAAALCGSEIEICDAVQIYNVESVTDREIPSTIQLIWSEDGQKALLLINRYPHAVFDFEAKRGYCRSNFPIPNPDWSDFDHTWDDAALDLFK